MVERKDVSKADYSGEDRSGMDVFAIENAGTGFPVDVRSNIADEHQFQWMPEILAGNSVPSRCPAEARYFPT